MTNTQNPTSQVRKGEELDIKAVDAALKSAISGLKGPPTVEQYSSGASNLTYALNYEARSLVLRRPPFGSRPKSGHDMYREYRIMTALRPVYPCVPTTLFYTDDESIIGAEFYVMDRVEGRMIVSLPQKWSDSFGWNTKKTRELCENFFQKLIDLHKVDYEAIGLSDFGKPQGYVERQISGWNKRWHKAWTQDVEKFEDVQSWLEENKPKTESGASILHGDFRIDNCILNLDDPAIIQAVLDWEISALGDPLMDLGNTLAYWIEADDPPMMQLMVRQPSNAPGMMTRQEVLKFYAERTGADISNFLVYYVYGIWRLAVIVQQIYYRYYHGQTDNSRFKEFGQLAGALGQLARRKISSGKI